MPHYVTLWKLTDQGIRNIKDAPQRIEEGIKTAEAAGLKKFTFLGSSALLVNSECDDITLPVLAV